MFGGRRFESITAAHAPLLWLLGLLLLQVDACACRAAAERNAWGARRR